MPITITLPQPSAVVGPGISLRLQSDFIGPLPTDAHWSVTILVGPNHEQAYVTDTRFDNRNPIALWLLSDPTASLTVDAGAQPAAGDTVRVRASLDTTSTNLDFGSVDVPWNPTLGLGLQIPLTRGASAQGGFTAQDRALLTTTEQRTSLLGEAGDLVVQSASGLLPTTIAALLSRNSLDQLIFEEMTSGPTCDPVRIVLAPIAQFAIIVRCTTVPEDVVFKTPDLEWSFQDLAVLRVFRGEDLIYRRGIHTVTFETDAPWAWGTNVLDKNLLGIPPPQTQVMVDWRTGVCGQVFIRHMP